MAKPRRKSKNDISRQFVRIWQAGVRNSDVYKSMTDESDDDARFRLADRELSKSKTLSEKDRRINEHINNADRVARRYNNNLMKGTGFNDSTGYLATGQRLDDYTKWQNKKYSYARRAGISG